MTPILNNILMRLGLLKSYRVHNELTGESFMVTGRSTKGCLCVARAICDQLGWDDEDYLIYVGAYVFYPDRIKQAARS